MSEKITEEVKEYYGKTLQGSKDLKTNACTCDSSMPAYQANILAKVEDEVLERFYGCGSPIPLELKGKTVLDLGCGTGRDVFLLSALVGEEGKVIGVDMTDEQLEVAQRNTEKQMQTFGFSKPNVEFIKGNIEDLQAAGIADNSVDIVVSNCVINLASDKEKVFREIFRVLKKGGELFFSDVFANARIPQELKDDPVLYGECLSGALYTEDFRRMLLKMGINDYRVMSRGNIELKDEILEKAGHISFESITVRAFNLEIEDKCEDYGQVATYLGTVDHAPSSFILDDHHEFIKNKPMLVCSNTAAMLQDTRFAQHFKIDGDLSTHYGLFDCSPAPSKPDSKSSGGCC